MADKHVGDPKSQNDGTAEWQKIPQNRKRQNGGIAGDLLGDFPSYLLLEFQETFHHSLFKGFRGFSAILPFCDSIL